MTANFLNPVSHLRLSGFIEGISYIVLLGIAMPLKYFAGFPEAVRVVGMLHGILFIWFMLSIAWAYFTINFSAKNAFLAYLSSLIPFGTFYIDQKLFRKL